MAIDLESQKREQEQEGEQTLKLNQDTKVFAVVYQKFGKRIFDILGAFVLLLFLAIPMLIIAVLVRLNSAGPALFRQIRFGFNSKPFVLVKFRSMRVNAPEKANKDFKAEERDSYITSLGRVLRKTSLDELPQLINILRGEMSFIGPRPLAESDAFVVHRRRLNGADMVKPGITGLAQVNGRNSISDEMKADLDAAYADCCCFTLDLSILLKSFLVVILQKGIDKK
ncbi:sugar transferase [Lacticaseibacillus paracasei]|uniref:sugar transferase n=1 Tax=Lacticaseibacillus paracasei TaxID=1597 RepID=UPI0009BE4485|nr:sugar transferase [Lacticaseibacillus paracasei]